MATFWGALHSALQRRHYVVVVVVVVVPSEGLCDFLESFLSQYCRQRGESNAAVLT